MSDPRAEGLTQISHEDVAAHIAAAAPRRPLRAGCRHQLIRFPLFQFSFDYLCVACHGYHEQTFTAQIAGMSLPEVDQLVGEQVGGTVTAEFVINHGALT